MTFIHITELTRLMLEYLGPAEAHALGLLLGDVFPKIALYSRSILAAYVGALDSDKFVTRCMDAVARAGWAGGPAKIRDCVGWYPRDGVVGSIQLALEHGHAGVVEELHLVNISLHARDGHLLEDGSIAYSHAAKGLLASAAVIGKTAPTLVKILGWYGADRATKLFVLEASAEIGCLVSLEYAFELDTWDISDVDYCVVCCAAARAGHFEVLKRLVRRWTPARWQTEPLGEGASPGRLRLIRSYADFSERTMISAWIGTRIDAIEFE